MDTLLDAIKALNSLSPLGVIGLLSYIIYKQQQSHTQVASLKTNDLHEMPELVAAVQRIEVVLSGLDSYLRARLNGKG